MEKNRLKKFVDPLREFAETIASMGMIRPEIFHWLWVTASNYFSQLDARNKINMEKCN